MQYTRYALAPGDLKVVPERLGHSTISTALDTFSYVTPGLQESVDRRFDDAVKVRHNDTVPKIIS